VRYEAYRTARAAGPVLSYRPTGAFFVTGYEDTATLLRDRRLAETDVFAGWPKLADRIGRDYADAIEFLAFFPFRYEGQRHAELRRAMAVGVAPFLGGHPAVNTHIARRLAEARRAGGFDLAADFANELFFEIVCLILEIGADDREVLRPLATASRLLEYTAPIASRDDFAARIGPGLALLEGYVETAVARGDEGFFSAVYDAWPPDEPNKARSTAALAVVLIMMANDALGGGITFAMVDLLSGEGPPRPPPGSWKAIVDELLRFASPIDLLARVATTEIDVGDVRIAPGESLIFSLTCANHDQAQFGDLADAVSEKANAATAIPFGAGMHLCVGNRLGRAIVAEAFGALADLPAMRVNGAVSYAPGWAVRTIASLPVEFR
jgi:cytochrome P450